LAEGRILKADPAYRRRILIGYSLFWALLLLTFLAVYQWGTPALLQYLERQKPADAARLLDVTVKASVLLSASLAVVASVYGVRNGWRIRTSGQLPPPGVRVLYDAPIIEGPAAVRWGTINMMVSVVVALVFVCLAAAFVLLWDFSHLWPAPAR
jgi:hypothetical protein